MLSDDLGWQHSYKRAFGVTYRSQLVMELSLLLEDGIIVQPLARNSLPQGKYREGDLVALGRQATSMTAKFNVGETQDYAHAALVARLNVTVSPGVFCHR